MPDMRPAFARRAALAGLLATSALSLPAVARAQPSAPQVQTVEEVVVTARRREERLQDVPIAVVALSQEALDEKGVRNANDLSQVAPGLSIQNTSGLRNTTTYSIRGQGQTFGQNSPGVVAYFGEVPQFSDAIFDLENIQVLKGPQGTLFGRNTTGGAILFSPQRPSETFKGYVVGRLGNYERRDLEFGVGGPIIADKLMVRLAGQILKREGYTLNLRDGQYLDSEDREAWRATVTVRPFEGFENILLYQHWEVDETGSGAQMDMAVPFGATAGIFAQTSAAAAAQRARGPRVVDYNYPLHYNVFEGSGWINTTTWTLNDHVTLKNIYSERRTSGGQAIDNDSSPFTILHQLNPPGPKATTKTEEFQVQLGWGPVSGVLGYYTEDSTQPLLTGFDVEQFTGAFVIRALNFGQSSGGSEAFYGQADWAVTDKLTLTAGLRSTEDERSSGPNQTYVLLPGMPAPTGLGPGASARQSSTFKATTWNLAAAYKVDPDLNLYATVRKGYKAGGFNGTALLPADRLFQPEEVTDYEVGIKGQRQFGEARFRFAADVFYDDYTNIQRFVNTGSVPPSTVTRNAASGSIKGVDLDLNLAPTPWFDLSLQYAYLDAKYERYIDAVDGDLTASRFPNTPEHQVTLTPRVRVPIPEHMGSLSVLASIYHQTSVAFDPANVPNGVLRVNLSSLAATIDGWTRVDLRADWKNAYGSPVSVGAYVRNALDEEYVTGTINQLTSTGTSASLYGQPRFYGLELRYQFGD